MAKRMLVRVFTRDDIGSYGPDYALVEVEDPALLTEKAQATTEFAARFNQKEAPSFGDVWTVEWRVWALGLKVTWLMADAIVDGDGAEPEWFDMEENNCEVPEDWQPAPGEADLDPQVHGGIHGHAAAQHGVDGPKVQRAAREIHADGDAPGFQGHVRPRGRSVPAGPCGPRRCPGRRPPARGRPSGRRASVPA